MNKFAFAQFGRWLPYQLFSFLRLMDKDASHSRSSDGRPFGLGDYGRHARPDLTRPQNEVEWSCKLIKLFSRLPGVVADGEVAYPKMKSAGARRRRCDIVLSLGDKRIWIEIKGAWRSYWGGNNKIYRSYLLHPLVSGLDASKSHTVPFDLMKLGTLASPQAHAVGQVLIGFEDPKDPIGEEVDTLVRLSDLPSWNSSKDSWESGSGERIKCWFWWRYVGGQCDSASKAP